MSPTDLYQVLPYLLAAVATVAYGILALWAAGSRRHWFLCASILLAAVLVLLLIPAYDLLIAAAVGVFVVVTAVGWWRWCQFSSTSKPRQNPSNSKLQISLRDLLLAFVIVAITAAVAGQSPPLPTHVLPMHAALGVLAGFLTAASAWTMFADLRWSSRSLALITVWLVATVGAAATLVGMKTWMAWAYNPARFSRKWTAIYSDYDAIDQYWGIAALIAMWVLCAWCALLRRSGWTLSAVPGGDDQAPPLDANSGQPPWHKPLAAKAVWALTVTTMTVPTFIIYTLARPLPDPTREMPATNNFDQLLLACKSIDEVELIKKHGSQDIKFQTQAGLEAIFAEASAGISAASVALEEGCIWPSQLEYDWADLPGSELSQLYRLFEYRCAYLDRLRDSDTTARLVAYTDLFRLSQLCFSGGMMANNFGESRALKTFWELREPMSDEQLTHVIDMLEASDAQPFRWRLPEWNRRKERQQGWLQYLNQLLGEWQGRRINYAVQYTNASRAALRLLVVDLSIAAYQRKHGRLPTTLEELIPEFLAAVPTDPFGASPLKYIIHGDDYRLYSVGPDRVDQGGLSLKHYWLTNGDLDLESLVRFQRDNVILDGLWQ